MLLGGGLRLVGSGQDSRGWAMGSWTECHLAATSWVLATVQEAKPYTPIASMVT